MDTIIRYTYRRGDMPFAPRQPIGPVYIDAPDTGEAPEVQAQRSCDKYGDRLVSAERVMRPLLYS